MAEEILSQIEQVTWPRCWDVYRCVLDDVTHQTSKLGVMWTQQDNLQSVCFVEGPGDVVDERGPKRLVELSGVRGNLFGYLLEDVGDPRVGMPPPLERSGLCGAPDVEGAGGCLFCTGANPTQAKRICRRDGGSGGVCV